LTDKSLAPLSKEYATRLSFVISTKCWPILKILQLLDSAINLLYKTFAKFPTTTKTCRHNEPVGWLMCYILQQENPAVADKPARRESMPKIAAIRRENNLQTI